MFIVRTIQRCINEKFLNIERTGVTMEDFDTIDDLIKAIKKNYKENKGTLLHSFVDEDKDIAVLEYCMNGTSVKHIIVIYEACTESNLFKKDKK